MKTRIVAILFIGSFFFSACLSKKISGLEQALIEAGANRQEFHACREKEGCLYRGRRAPIAKSTPSTTPSKAANKTLILPGKRKVTVCAGNQKNGIVFLNTKPHNACQFNPDMIFPIFKGVKKPRKDPPVARICVSVILCNVMNMQEYRCPVRKNNHRGVNPHSQDAPYQHTGQDAKTFTGVCPSRNTGAYHFSQRGKDGKLDKTHHHAMFRIKRMVKTEHWF